LRFRFGQRPKNSWQGKAWEKTQGGLVLSDYERGQGNILRPYVSELQCSADSATTIIRSHWPKKRAPQDIASRKRQALTALSHRARSKGAKPHDALRIRGTPCLSQWCAQAGSAPKPSRRERVATAHRPVATVGFLACSRDSLGTLKEKNIRDLNRIRNGSLVLGEFRPSGHRQNGAKKFPQTRDLRR